MFKKQLYIWQLKTLSRFADYTINSYNPFFFQGHLYKNESQSMGRCLWLFFLVSFMISFSIGCHLGGVVSQDCILPFRTVNGIEFLRQRDCHRISILNQRTNNPILKRRRIFFLLPNGNCLPNITRHQMIKGNIIQRCHFNKPELSVTELIFRKSKSSISLRHRFRSAHQRRKQARKIQWKRNVFPHSEKRIQTVMVRHPFFGRRIGIQAQFTIRISGYDIHISHFAPTGSEGGGFCVVVERTHEKRGAESVARSTF